MREAGAGIGHQRHTGLVVAFDPFIDLVVGIGGDDKVQTAHNIGDVPFIVNV